MNLIKRLWPKKQDKIEFYTTLHGLQHLYPVVPASELKMPWAAKSKALFKDKVADPVVDPVSASHMCSGIAELMKTGFVLTSYFDMTIETNGDGHTFNWSIPSSVPEQILHDKPITSFDAPVFGDIATFPPQSLKTVIKVHTPWFFKMPPGWGMLMAPFHYMDEDRFTQALGILDPAVSNQLHAVLFWHVLNGTVTIPAGTPLAHLIPVRLDSTMPYITRDVTEDEQKLESIQKYARFSTFLTNRARIKQTYHNATGRCPFGGSK